MRSIKCISIKYYNGTVVIDTGYRVTCFTARECRTVGGKVVACYDLQGNYYYVA